MAGSIPGEITFFHVRRLPRSFDQATPPEERRELKKEVREYRNTKLGISDDCKRLLEIDENLEELDSKTKSTRRPKLSDQSECILKELREDPSLKATQLAGILYPHASGDKINRVRALNSTETVLFEKTHLTTSPYGLPFLKRTSTHLKIPV